MTRFTALTLAIVATAFSSLSACGGGGGSPEPVTISPAGPNAVSYWNEVATTTVNVPASATGTPRNCDRTMRSTWQPCMWRSTTR